MSAPPPFVLPPDGWRGRLAALLAGVARQRTAVALLALAALLGAGAVWLRATPRPAGPLDAVGGPPGAAAEAAQTLPRAVPDGQAGEAQAGGRVAVHVAGRVRRPGLVRLAAGSRVQDAVRAAGGATAGANLDAVNLARKLVDGEQVRVPGKGEAAAAPAPPGGGSATPAGPLDLNTATVEQLEALPGVGEVTAGRIVAYRSAHPFTSVDELLEVPGIGQRRFEQLKDLVTVA
jgi:competence protein ComEA